MMTFANSYFLFALAGIAVPILIHIFTRDHVKHAAFSTLRFFTKGAKLVVRRKKFQEMLLIAMRALMMALLALIFARPYFKAHEAIVTNGASTARLVVADISGSMRRGGLPDALKKEALGALESLNDGEDAAGLITFDDAPAVAAPVSKNLAQAKTAAESITPGYGGTNLEAALRKANEMLRSVAAKQKEIVLISDLPREGWHYFKGDWKLGEDVKLTVRPLKPADTASAPSIVEASAPSSLVLDGQPSSIAVRVCNYSDEPRNDFDVTLMLNGQKADSQRINIRPHSTAAVRFRHVFDTPGDNPGSVIAGADTSDGVGNVFYFNARPLPRIPVLIVNGRPSANPQTDAAFFIGKALAPTASSPFSVKTLAAGAVTAKDVAEANVVVLANAGTLPSPVTSALTDLMQRGGGVFFLPGDQVNAEAFNAAFGELAPCKLRQILKARPANGETAESLTRVDFEHPVFEIFGQPHHGDLTMPKFAKYWETTDTQLSRVLARFGDGRPAILEREIGKGVSMALVSAVDSNWTDFARQSVFLPYLHQTVRYLAVRGGQRTSYTCGDSLPLPQGSTLKDPRGKTHPATEAAATQPGFYYALNQEGKADFCYAVNGSFAESDPATVAPDEIAAAIERAPGEMLGGLDLDAAAVSEAQPGKKPDNGMWWALLCGLVILTMAELVVSNKTLRH